VEQTPFGCSKSEKQQEGIGTSMDKKDTLRKIDELVNFADKLAIDLIKSEARKILQADPNLYEFVMAMGSCFFTIKEGGKYDIKTMTDEEWDEWVEADDYVHEYNGIVDSENFHPEFFEMVEELDEKFKCKGYPVRFTANSQEVYDWGDTQKNPVEYNA
jgi:hypothetical protein